MLAMGVRSDVDEMKIPSSGPWVEVSSHARWPVRGAWS